MNHFKKFKLILVLITLSAGLQAQVSQPTQSEIDAGIAASENIGRIISVSPAGLSIPSALQELTSLPVVFKTAINGLNYEIVVLKMALTPTGSTLSIGARIKPTNTQIPLYFGSNSIAVSAKKGFAGTMNILESTLSNAKSTEIDDPAGALAGQTRFVELPITDFRDNATLGLGQNTKLTFECGEFIKLNIEGYLKVFNQVVREEADGLTMTDSKPLMLFFNNQDITDWYDMYMPATVSRGFHSSQFTDISFHFLPTSKIFIDLSTKQNPKNLPICSTTGGTFWQGVAFDEFDARLPKLLLLKTPRDLIVRASNLFLEANGLLGNVSAENVFDLPEGYTDEKNRFELSLDNFTASYICGGTRNLTMVGRIKLGKCDALSGANKVLKYNINRRGTSIEYEALVKENDNQSFRPDGMVLSTGSTISLGFDTNGFKFESSLSKKPTILTTAYNNSICSTFSTSITASDCGTNSLKWSNGEGNVPTINISPSVETTYTVNCFDKFCINETSNPITIKVYNGLPDLSLAPVANQICSFEKGEINVVGNCPGKIEWILPSSTEYALNDVRKQEIYFPDILLNTNAVYAVRCNLDGCLSNQTTSSAKTVVIKKAPKAPVLTSDNDENKVCTGSSILISGQCENASEVFAWTAGTTSTSSSFTFTTDPNTPKDVEHIYKATCTADGCSTEAEIKIKEFAISSPTALFATRNPIETGGEVEMIAMGCGKDNYKWSTGETGSWDGAENSILKKKLDDDANYTVQCIKNGCLSAPSKNLWVNVLPCLYAYPKPVPVYVSDVNPVSGSEVILTVGGCPNNNYSFSSGVSGGSYYGELNGMSTYTFKAYPTETSFYTVKCKRDDNCYSDLVGFAPVNVKPCAEGYPKPVPLYVSNANPILGEEVLLSVKGCPNDDYVFSHGITERSLYSSEGGNVYRYKVRPTETSFYTVKCKRDENCYSDVVGFEKVTVKTCAEGLQAPTSINADKTSITSGETVKITAFGCGTVLKYEWDDGTQTGDDTNGATFRDLTPAVTTTYKVRCFKDVSCKSDWSGLVTVTVTTSVPCSTPSAPVITLTKTAITATESINVSATCSTGSSVVWTSPANFTAGDKTPGITTTYSAKCSTATGCESAVASSTVTVNNCATAPEAPILSSTKNTDGSYSLNASCQTGAPVWTAPAGYSGENVVLTTSTQYRAKCSLNTNCVSSEGLINIVIPMSDCVTPNAPTLVVSPTTPKVIPNSVVNLTANCAYPSTVNWIKPTSFRGGDYSIVNSDVDFEVNCKSSISLSGSVKECLSPSVNKKIEVKTKCDIEPIVRVVGQSICLGSESTLSVSNCIGGTCEWNNGMTGNEIKVKPLVGINTFSVRCKYTDRCITPEISRSVTVIAKPTTIPTISHNIPLAYCSDINLTVGGCSPNEKTKWFQMIGNLEIANEYSREIKAAAGLVWTLSASCVNESCSGLQSEQKRVATSLAKISKLIHPKDPFCKLGLLFSDIVLIDLTNNMDKIDITGNQLYLQNSCIKYTRSGDRKIILGNVHYYVHVDSTGIINKVYDYCVN